MGKRSLPVFSGQAMNEDHRKTRRTCNEPGHAHELTFSCYRRWPLLSKDRTRSWLVQALNQARQRWQFDIWAYVIMPEHAHILVWPRSASYDISLILKSIKQPVARRAMSFLRATAPTWLERLKVVRPSGRTEYRFWQQGGGYDRNVVREDAAWQIIDYIHLNPVRRGLVERSEDWPWSTAGWYAGLRPVVLEPDEPPLGPTPTQCTRRPVRGILV